MKSMYLEPHITAYFVVCNSLTFFRDNSLGLRKYVSILTGYSFILGKYNGSTFTWLTDVSLLLDHNLSCLNTFSL